MYRILFFLFIFSPFLLIAQPAVYTTANAHSHNDYVNPVPFFAAYNESFGSIEADIFLTPRGLLVGHDTADLRLNRSLADFYLKPLLSYVKKNNGHVYADSTRHLQLLIDIKTDSVKTLEALVSLLQQYPALINASTLRFVITGNRPDESTFTSYPKFIWFDAEMYKNYSQDALTRIVMMSDDFKNYSQWNGKSNIPAADENILKTAVAKAHNLHKPVRFWDAPDVINAWYQFIDLKVDYLNTDHIQTLSKFFGKLTSNSFTAATKYETYQPTYQSDGLNKAVKNVILLIGDGTGLPQLYAGYTANKAALNIFKMLNIGISKTSSYDSYITDSAPGSTAFSSGEKTNNRSVGVDHTGAALPLLPVFLEKLNIKTGLVSCGDVTDATPADFYGHVTNRDSSAAILHNLATEPIQLLMGAPTDQYNNQLKTELTQHQFNVTSSIDSVPDNTDKKWLVMQPKAGLSMLNGRGNWLQQAFMKSVGILSKNKAGFFLMTEGAQVDYGGHANNLAYVATEVMDFDQVVGDALKFADSNGETLVIVTADHETGGLTLLGGDYAKGSVSGQFSTNDHTALPVMVFAYGPQSQLFRGVYENTAVFNKILQAYGIKK